MPEEVGHDVTSHACAVRSRWAQGGSRLPKLPGTSNLPMDTQHAFKVAGK